MSLIGSVLPGNDTGLAAMGGVLGGVFSESGGVVGGKYVPAGGRTVQSFVSDYFSWFR